MKGPFGVCSGSGWQAGQGGKERSRSSSAAVGVPKPIIKRRQMNFLVSGNKRSNRL